MITYDGYERTMEENDFAFKGLSTDTKPTETYGGKSIKNGSTFLEMDTLEVKFYNADSDTWI